MNHGYAGTRELNEALASRFVVLQLPLLDGDGLEQLIGTEFARLKAAGRRLMAQLFLDLQQKCAQAEISSKAVDLRGLLDALHLVELGLPVRQALDMGLVNKCFDAEERALVADVIALRIAAGMTSAELFD